MRVPPQFLFSLLLFFPAVFAAQTSPDSPVPKPVADDARDSGGTTSGKKEVERRQEQPPRATPGAVADRPATPVATKPATTSPAVTVTAEQWARPRSGEAVARLPELVRLVEALDRNPSQRLVVRHASGDDGTLWAEELRSWFVALGVPSVNIELAPGAPEADKLSLELRRHIPR